MLSGESGGVTTGVEMRRVNLNKSTVIESMGGAGGGCEIIRYAWPKIKVVFSIQRENNTGPPSLQDPKGRPVSRVKADHTFGLRSKEPVPSSSNQPGSSSATSYVTSTRIRPGASRLSLRRPKLLLQKMASGSFNIIGLREKAGPSD